MKQTSARHKIGAIITLLVGLLIFSGCTNNQNVKPFDIQNVSHSDLIQGYPESVFYEIFVRAFYDSTGDGIGDINGMTQQLDYLQDLGVEGIWLMPINPSPSYHGYDVTNYYDIHPDYGTMDDFKKFLEEAHKRDIKVLMDLVVNHSSYDHPWFQEAISSDNNPYRDWYIWADEETNVRDRGEWGQNLWHRLGSSDDHYMSVFWDRMPDFNFYNEDVREEMINIGKFWLEEVGVDGFRLDAAKHIFPYEKDQNLVWWAEFRAAMEEVKPDVFLVGEVWDIASVTGPYLEAGLHSTFNFDLAEDILSAVNNERAGSLVDKLIRTLDRFEDFSDDFVDSTFITNHDINRVMSQFRGNVERNKVAASLLLTLPGAPFIYYGEEIGMEGVKPDEHIREPMLWYNDPSQGGQTTWINPRHNLGEDAPTVEQQLEDPESLLNHYKTLIYVRRSHRALLSGNLKDASISERGILAFKREYDEDEVLIVHNLSKSEVTVSLEEETQRTVFFSTTENYTVDGDSLIIPAYSSIIFMD